MIRSYIDDHNELLEPHVIKLRAALNKGRISLFLAREMTIAIGESIATFAREDMRKGTDRNSTVGNAGEMPIFPPKVDPQDELICLGYELLRKLTLLKTASLAKRKDELWDASALAELIYKQALAIKNAKLAPKLKAQ